MRLDDLRIAMLVYYADQGLWDKHKEDPGECKYVVAGIDRTVYLRHVGTGTVRQVVPGRIQGPYAAVAARRIPVLTEAARAARMLELQQERARGMVKEAQDAGFNVNINPRLGTVVMDLETLARIKEWCSWL